MAGKNWSVSGWNRINGELFGELVFHDIADEYRDTYVVGFARQLQREELRLESYYVNQEGRFTKAVHHYPQALSGLYVSANQDESIASFVRQLDARLVDTLIGAGMDSLAAYALLHNHPTLRKLVRKPLLLMAAYIRLYRFEKLDVSNYEAYEDWFPKLFFRDRLSKGVYKVLSRIDTSDPKKAVSAAEYVIRNYQPMKRLLRGNGVLRPCVIREVILGVGRFPELMEAKWYYAANFEDANACTESLSLYYDTRALLQMALVQDWRRVLLRQVESLEQLRRLHDRYIPRSLTKVDIPPETPLQDYGIKDNERFSVVRTAGELLICAERLSNCAAIFVAPSVTGSYIHAIYNWESETGLLQIYAEDRRSPYIAEFKRSHNRPVSAQAWVDAGQWLRDCAPKDGELAYQALVMSVEKVISSGGVEEAQPHYSVMAPSSRLRLLEIV